MEDTPSLLRRYAEEQSQPAFATFVHRYFDAVYSTALRRCNGRADLAKDAAQEVFIKAARHAAQLSRHPVPSAWLYATARNVTINLLRAESRRLSHEKADHAMDELHPAKNPAPDWTTLAPVLDQSMDALQEKDRRVILLRFFDQHSFAQIAATFSLSEDAARMRVERALARLRHILARRGINASAGSLGLLLAQNTVSAAPAGLASTVLPSVLSAAASTSPLFTWLGAKALLIPASLALVSLLITAALCIDLSHAHTAAARTRLAEENEIARLEATLRTIDSRPAPTSPEVTRVPAPAPGPLLTASSAPPQLGGGRRLFLSSAYQPLYRSLALTTDDIRLFEDLCLKGPNTGLWLSTQESAQPPATSPAFLPPAEVEIQLAALLGPKGFSEYTAFTRTMPARSLTALLAGTVYLTDPLSPDTGEKLTDAIAHASTSYQKGSAVSLADVNWDQVLQTTQLQLSEPQRQALNALRIRHAVERALAPDSIRR